MVDEHLACFHFFLTGRISNEKTSRMPSQRTSSLRACWK